MTPEQEERLVVAFEQLAQCALQTREILKQDWIAHAGAIASAAQNIADGVDFIAMTAEARFKVEHPTKPETPRPMDVTRLPTEEDLIRDELEGPDAGDALDKWLTLGPREKEFDRQRSEKETAGETGAPRRGTGEVRD